MILKFTFSLFLIILFACSTTMNETDRVSEEVIKKCGEHMKKKGLKIIGTGGGEKNGKINLVEVSFVINQKLDIQSARVLIVDSANCLLNEINKNSKHEEIFAKFPAPVDIMHISIFGLESSENTPDYVGIVSILQGSIRYKVDNNIPPGCALRTIHKETFEEAQQILSQSSGNS